MNFKYIVSICCFAAVITGNAMAQTKPAKPASPVLQKFKPPKLYTSIGSKNDTLITVPVDEAIALAGQQITVTDDKKGLYSISSYQCLYKRKGVTEDEESGKVSPTTSIVVQRFSTTPLSAIWQKTISEQLKAGEEISFFDIVVKDAQNRFMFAPAFKIVVK